MADANQFGLYNQSLLEIKEIATLLHQLKESDEFLLSELNRLDAIVLKNIAARYAENTGPVNSLRKDIAIARMNGETITKEWIDQGILKIEKESHKISFRAYNYFSLLFPFFQISFKIDVKETLTQFSAQLQNSLNLAEKTKIHTVDFWGPRGFGDDRVWTAIYNASHVNQQTAKQLFIEINQNGCFCGVYDRLNQVFIEEARFEIDTALVEKVFQFFKPFVRLIEIDYYDGVSFLQIGVKGVKFYKLSHGKEFFAQEEIQGCIDANIAVVHKDTRAKAKTAISQYEIFEKAKIGDLFYCCWGNNQFLLIGQFLDTEIRDYSLTTKPDGWKERSYRIIREVQLEESYRGAKKWWAPNDPSTFIQVPEEDYNQLNQIILRPYFQAELIADKDPSMPQDKVGISAQKEIRVIDGKVSPKLDVQLIAKEFARIIDNLEDNKGQMLGVFGSWGRGKTFFVDCVKEEFEPKKYININFNAWKYQETEAIWAYLYEVILDTYLADGVPKEAGWLKRKGISKTRTFLLNFKRKGITKFAWIFLSFFASLIIAYAVSFSFKEEVMMYLISAVGIIGIVQAYVIYKRYYQGIKDVLNDYSSKVNYRSVLGLQAEIQTELVILVKHWLKGKDTRRIVLFVDDLDRCSENKIIHIIDALRVMLDDDLLVKKLIIIVAVDALLLERAIELKYVDFKIDKGDKNLVQEYMDKLFIAGIKFPSLNREEQVIILENYAIKGEILETKVAPTVEIDSPTVSANSESTNTSFLFPDPEVMSSKIIESEFFLLRSELELLQKYSHEISANVTPRGLRIYMYRYLLSKNLASAYMAANTGFRLDDSVCAFLAKAIAHRSADSAFDIKAMEEMTLLKNDHLKEFLPKLIEMVVPY